MADLITKRLPNSVGDPPRGPTYAVWEVTLKCNQKCRFCGTRAGHPRRNELDTEECLDVVRQLARFP
jgi:MoaA/NifB/PqqE/SkfB family radical SAM enzyme